MMHPFSELVIGGVFLAPFVAYAVASLVIVLVLRPILRLLRVQEMSAILRSPRSASMS